MEMNLFEIAGEVHTRIKILKSQYSLFKKILASCGITKPSKASSRYIYFEIKGDLLNSKKVEG